MAWTLWANTGENQSAHRPYHWNQFFLDWAAGLAYFVSVEEAQIHIIDPVLRLWPATASLTDELLRGYIMHHIGYIAPPTPGAQENWRYICNRLLDTQELKNCINYDYLGNDMAQVVSLMLYVGWGGQSLLTTEWSHAPLFQDIADKWVTVVGGNPHAFAYLLIMLDGPGWVFAPEPAIEWLCRCAQNTRHPQEFWNYHSNAITTAELLSRMLNEFADRIKHNQSMLRRFANLVDQLVAQGVPVARVLQQRLEGTFRQ